ncbi:MAG: hypothetical protein ACR2QE_21145, partial [Acidimicrobiales bacterium]
MTPPTKLETKPAQTQGSSADAPKHGEASEDEQWAPRPWLARAIRTFAFIFPIVMSVVFVIIVSGFVSAPAGWVGRAIWWVGLTVAATLVLIVFERLT